MEIFCSLVIILFSPYYKLYFTTTKNAFQNKQQFLGFRIYKEIPIGKKKNPQTWPLPSLWISYGCLVDYTKT